MHLPPNVSLLQGSDAGNRWPQVSQNLATLPSALGFMDFLHLGHTFRLASTIPKSRFVNFSSVPQSKQNLGGKPSDVSSTTAWHAEHRGATSKKWSIAKNSCGPKSTQNWWIQNEKTHLKGVDEMKIQHHWHTMCCVPNTKTDRY